MEQGTTMFDTMKKLFGKGGDHRDKYKAEIRTREISEISGRLKSVRVAHKPDGSIRVTPSTKIASDDRHFVSFATSGNKMTEARIRIGEGVLIDSCWFNSADQFGESIICDVSYDTTSIEDRVIMKISRSMKETYGGGTAFKFRRQHEVRRGTSYLCQSIKLLGGHSSPVDAGKSRCDNTEYRVIDGSIYVLLPEGISYNA